MAVPLISCLRISCFSHPTLLFPPMQKSIHIFSRIYTRDRETKIGTSDHLAGHQWTDQGIQAGQRGFWFQEAAGLIGLHDLDDTLNVIPGGLERALQFQVARQFDQQRGDDLSEHPIGFHVGFHDGQQVGFELACKHQPI